MHLSEKIVEFWAQPPDEKGLPHDRVDGEFRRGIKYETSAPAQAAVEAVLLQEEPADAGDTPDVEPRRQSWHKA